MSRLRRAVRLVVWCMVSFIVGPAAPTACQSTTASRINSPDLVSNTSIVYAEDLIWYEQYWSREVYRRYPNAIIIMSHGFDYNGQWWCDYTSLETILVEDLVALIREQYPVRRIVLVICNPGGYTLDLSNVSYSLENMWRMPDRDLSPRSFVKPGVSGNVYEMQENQ